MYYNHRFLKEGETDAKKNRFRLRDAQIQLEGRYKNLVEIELQIDLADIPLAQSDPENTVLRDAFVTFKGIPYLSIKAGYMKVPYSRYSLTPFKYQAFWQRAQFARGHLFSRRDVGATLSTEFWRQLVNIEVGVFTGIGESSILGNNDASGQPEFIGRAEISYPSRFRKRNVDTRNVHIPMFSFGANARYVDQTQPEGSVLTGSLVGDYGVKVLDGSRLSYGIDAAFKFHGVMMLFESHWITAKPSAESHYLFQTLPDSLTDGFVRSSAMLAEVSYHLKQIGLTIAGRYDLLNANDLVTDRYEAISASINYRVPKIPCELRAQYFHPLSEEADQPLTWTDQIRIGFIYQFQ